jgi:hypothetical protein
MEGDSASSVVMAELYRAEANTDIKYIIDDFRNVLTRHANKAEYPAL